MVVTYLNSLFFRLGSKLIVKTDEIKLAKHFLVSKLIVKTDKIKLAKYFLVPRLRGFGPKSEPAYTRKSSTVKWEESPHTLTYPELESWTK